MKYRAFFLLPHNCQFLPTPRLYITTSNHSRITTNRSKKGLSRLRQLLAPPPALLAPPHEDRDHSHRILTYTFSSPGGWYASSYHATSNRDSSPTTPKPLPHSYVRPIIPSHHSERHKTQITVSETRPSNLVASSQPPSSSLATFAKLAAIVKAHGKVNTELRVRFQVLEDQMDGTARMTGSEPCHPLSLMLKPTVGYRQWL